VAATGSARELTLRALIAGGAIGVVLAAGNVYMGLKTGWTDTGNVTAAMLGFAIFGLVGRRASYGRLENNITMITAVSAGLVSFSGGIVYAIPALRLEGVRPPLAGLAAWSFCVSLLGIGLAAMLRKRFIESERLAFPTGIATAELIGTMHTGRAETLGRTRALALAALLAMIVVWFRDGRPAWLPAATLIPGSVLGVPVAAWELGLAYSPVLLGSGLLVGARIGVSVLAGAILTSVLLGPLALHLGAIAHADRTSLLPWVIWPAVALMLGSILTSLALDWRRWVRGVRDLGSVRIRGHAGYGVLAALLTLAVLALGWLVFHVGPLPLVAGLAFSIVLGSVCARATAETDVAPVTQMGNLTQLVLGPLSAGQADVNMAAAMVVSGGASHASFTLEDLKTGHLLGARVRPQLLAHVVGAAVGAIVAVAAYELIARAYTIGGKQMQAPAMLTFRGMANLVRSGLVMPPHALVASVIAGGAGIALALGERSRLRRFLPSPFALSIGLLVPGNGATIALGGALAALLRARKPEAYERFGVSAAAGMIVGESLLGVLIAILVAAGVLAAA
jgi:uncharacterized oligopeptide transporter (OPT) family protein